MCFDLVIISLVVCIHKLIWLYVSVIVSRCDGNCDQPWAASNMAAEQNFDPCTEIHNPKWWQLYAAFETNLIKAFKHYHPPQSIIPIHIRISTKTPLPSPTQVVLALALACTEEDIEKMLIVIDVTKDLGQIERLVPWLIISHLVHQSTFPTRIASYLGIENSNFAMTSCKNTIST